MRRSCLAPEIRGHPRVIDGSFDDNPSEKRLENGPKERASNQFHSESGGTIFQPKKGVCPERRAWLRPGCG